MTQMMEVAHPTIELNRLEEEFSSAQHFYIWILWIMAANLEEQIRKLAPTHTCAVDGKIALHILFRDFSFQAAASRYPVVRRATTPMAMQNVCLTRHIINFV